jgi:uncharacterized membrane protein YidH (DUF202 family)
MSFEMIFLSLAILITGVGLVVIARAYCAYKRKEKAFDYNPWA